LLSAVIISTAKIQLFWRITKFLKQILIYTPNSFFFTHFLGCYITHRHIKESYLMQMQSGAEDFPSPAPLAFIIICRLLSHHQLLLYN